MKNPNDSRAIQSFSTDGWNGLNQRDFATLFLVEPPDINLAVGPNFV